MTDSANNPTGVPPRSNDRTRSGFPREEFGTPLSDELLLLRIVDRDPSAMKILFDRYSGLVFSVAMKVLRNREASEDLLQDVFFKLWNNPATYVMSRGSLGAWLHVIARNRAIDMLRKRRPADSIDNFQLSSNVNIASEIEQLAMVQKVREVMASLPQEQQHALDLAYFEGLSHSEISERTGCPLGTVKTRVRSALTHLRKALQV